MYELIQNDGALAAYVTTKYKSHRGVSKSDLVELLANVEEGIGCKESATGKKSQDELYISQLRMAVKKLQEQEQAVVQREPPTGSNGAEAGEAMAMEDPEAAGGIGLAA